MSRFFRRLVTAAAIAALAAGPALAQGGGDRAAALDYLGRGKAAFRMGDLVEATRQWSETIRLCRLTGDRDTEAEALTRRGEAYRVAGHLKDARQDLEAALQAAERNGDQELIAAAAGALGNLAFIARRTATAEPLLQRSRALARQLHDPAILAASANDLGNLYTATDRAAAAAAAYDEAIAAAGTAGDTALTATAETNAARLAFRQDDLLRANELLARAVARLERLPPTRDRGMGLIAAGAVVFERAGQIDPAASTVAERALEMALATADDLRNPIFTSLVLGSLGRLGERAGRLDVAAKMTARALFAAQQAAAPELSARWEWQQGRLLRRQGRMEPALASYRRAVGELQSVRQDIPVEYRGGRSSYRATYGLLYLEFADLLLRKAAGAGAAAAPLLKEARDSVELLKETELQDFFRDPCVTSFEAKERSIDTVAPGTAVVYPIVLPDRLELLVSFGREQRQFTVAVDEARLRRDVKSFRGLLEKRTTNEYLPLAASLYDRILRPLDAVLVANRIDTLVFVPDSVLRLIPFGALYDGEHFLIERYATAIAPSLRLVDPKPLSLTARSALTVGISQSVQGFAGLPNVKREVDAVRDLQGGKALLNDAFQRSRFEAELRTESYNLVHIASHGEFGSDPSRTFVLAFDGPLTMDDLERDIKFGEFREIPLELLTLSACETAAGDDRSGLGLAGIALKSGARSAMATLWSVNDRAAGDLVLGFYGALKDPKLSKAHALQAAQLALLNEPVFSHPSYWAPFLLVGNWL
jgi:CHAT domain-containing protein